jgi:hypothetical protein
MSDWHIRQSKPWQIERRCVWSERASLAWTTLKGLPVPAKLALGLILLVLLGALSGCATPSPPVTSPKNPSPPRISEPLPEESYSLKAQRLIDSWLKPATGM